MASASAIHQPPTANILTTATPATVMASASATHQTPVRDLVRFAVNSANLQYPEYCFNVIVDFAKKLKDDRGVLYLKMILCGLLNTSGGILEIWSSTGTPPTKKQLDQWKQNLEDALRTFIPYSVCRKCIRLLDYSYPVKMVVKKSPKLITLNSNMYERWLVGNRLVNDVDDISDVINQPTARSHPDPFQGVQALTYGHTVSKNEGPSIEFKCWNGPRAFDDIKAKDTYRKRLQDDRTRRVQFALPNMPEGGYLILGIEEDELYKSNTIRGQVITMADEDDMTQFITSYLVEDETGNPRIWGDGSRLPQLGKDWDIRFIPVTGGPSGERRRVIVIHFNHFPGGVWERCPDSYLISEEGFIHQMSFDQWKEYAVCTKETCSTESSQNFFTFPRAPHAHKAPLQRGNEASIPSPNKAEGQETRITKQLGDIDSAAQAVGSHQEPGDQPESVVPSTPVAQTDQVLLGRDCLSWTEDKPDWSNILADTGITLEDHVDRFARESSLFAMETPMVLRPDKRAILASQSCSKGDLGKAIDHIVQHSRKKKSFGLVMTQWTSNMEMRLAVHPPNHHIIDVFVLDEEGRIKLWAVTNTTPKGSRDVWEYVLLAGRVTKRKLLLHCPEVIKHSACLKTDSLWVECFVYQLHQGEDPHTASDWNQLSDVFLKSSATVSDTKVGLAAMFLETKTQTHIKSVFGDDLSVVLTVEQMEILMSMGLDKFNFIEGPPGSGKTYLALSLCQNYRNFGYIYTSKPFNKFLMHQGLDEKRLFYFGSSQDLVDHIDGAHFDTIEYLIVDDYQNAHCPKATWEQLFKLVTEKQRMKLVIFGDSRYQNYNQVVGSNKSYQYMHEFCEDRRYHWTHKTLSVIHRNTKKIVSFIKSNYESTTDFPDHSQITCSHADDGDDVEIRYLPGVMTDTNDNSLIQFTNSLIASHSKLSNEQHAYEPRDIVILVDTQDAEKDARTLTAIYRKHTDRRIDVHDADTFPVTGITIDTLDNFMGFDRKVCILLTREDGTQSDHHNKRSVHNPCYRTFVASRGVSRAVFIVDCNLNTSVASSFNIPSVTHRLWHLEQTRQIADLCFLDIGGRPSVLYSSVNDRGGSDVRVVTMEGAGLPTTVDSPGMRLTLSTASSEDGQRAVLAGGGDVDEGPWCWEVYRSRPGRVEKVQSFPLDGYPWSVAWTPDGDVFILLDKPGVRTLVRLSPSDGRELWRRGESDTRLSDPGRVTVCPSNGEIYVSDLGCIRELGPDGRHRRDIPTPGVIQPFALSVDSPGRTLFVADWEDTESEDSRNRDIFVLATNGGRPRKVIRAPGRVLGICLHEDKKLGVGTLKGLLLYDVAALL